MKKNIFTVLIPIFFLLACNNDKLTIIDGIVLGQSKDQYSTQLEVLNIPNKDFYTNFLVLREKDSANKINFFYTKLFNYDEFKSESRLIEHFGVFVPEFINNKNLTALKIFLGHTGKVDFLDPKMNNNEIAVYLRQDVVNDVLNKIIALYTLKYGKPNKEIKLYGPLVGEYLYENNFKKISFDSDEERFYIWETDYYTITLFYGFNLNAYYENGTYSTSTDWLLSNLSKERLSENQKLCFSLSYIKYELTQKGLKQIGLDKMKY